MAFIEGPAAGAAIRLIWSSAADQCRWCRSIGLPFDSDAGGHSRRVLGRSRSALGVCTRVGCGVALALGTPEQHERNQYRRGAELDTKRGYSAASNGPTTCHDEAVTTLAKTLF